MSSDAGSPSIVIPQPEEIPDRQREDAMGAYLMMFASLALGLPIPLLNIVASVIYFFVNRKSGTFVAFHALQALLSHIPVVLLNAGAIGWLIAVLVVPPHNAFGPYFFYLFFSVLANLAWIIWSIVALVHARKGHFVYMPVIGRLCFAHYYGPGAQSRRAADWQNRPPEGL